MQEKKKRNVRTNKLVNEGNENVVEVKVRGKLQEMKILYEAANFQRL